jgi:hypothetical protein
MVKRSLRLVAAGAAAIGLVLGASADKSFAEFPEKPVELTVLFGGTANSIGQLLADLMS